MNIYGCDYWWVYSNGRPQYGFESKIIHKRDHSNCNHPHAWGWLAVAYFISFVVLGSQVLMTLFVGIVATAMEEKKEIQKAEDIREKRLDARQVGTCLAKLFRQMLCMQSHHVALHFKKIF